MTHDPFQTSAVAAFRLKFVSPTDRDIAELTWALNSTPRKCLGFKTPAEAFLENLKGVALEL